MLGTMVRGAIAGTVATWVMDVVTTRVQQSQSPADKRKEQAAWPNGQWAVANLVDLGGRLTGVKVADRYRPAVESAIHFGLGAVPGALYAVARDRLPLVGAGRGLIYGLLLFALNDEFLNTALGLAGPPSAYPMSSHVRGLVGHVTLGVATDVGITILAVA
jgi:hypothetical protein